MAACVELYPQVTIVNQATASYSANGDSGDLDAGGFHYLLAGFTTGSITGGTAQVIMSL